ncbi:MAG TPA: hypothetical protein VF424_14650 [Vicinamibacterales bacterium]
MRRNLFVLAALVVMASAGILVYAQHGAPRGASHAQFFHAGCAQNPTDAQTGHVPEHLSTYLSLTPAQTAEIDKLAAQACQLHQQFLNVLTPEQQEKLKQLHGGGDAPSGLHEWFKKLHGR